MNNNKETGEQHGERPAYKKPQLRCIELVTEEVLAKGCKLETGNNQLNPIGCTSPQACVNSGS